MPTALHSQTTAESMHLGGKSAQLEALHDALASECRLLEDLIAQMQRQRSAVGIDDIQGVDDSTFATHRILATLGQARRRRRQLNVLLGNTEECTLTELEAMLGDLVDARLREARLRLQRAADLLAREVRVNRKLLREAIAHNIANAETGGSSCQQALLDLNTQVHMS